MPTTCGASFHLSNVIDKNTKAGAEALSGKDVILHSGFRFAKGCGKTVLMSGLLLPNDVILLGAKGYSKGYALYGLPSHVYVGQEISVRLAAIYSKSAYAVGRFGLFDNPKDLPAIILLSVPYADKTTIGQCGDFKCKMLA